MKNFLEWLSAPEGPNLIDSHSDPPTMPYMALAVALDPDHLYWNPKGVVVRIGLVYKPYYSFLLPRVMAKCNKNSTEYTYCTGYPRHPGGRPTLINPIALRQKNDAFLREVLCFPMALASRDHWVFLEDTELQAWVSSLEKEREKTREGSKASKSEEQEGASGAPSGDIVTGIGGDSKDEEIMELPQDGMGNDVMDVDGDIAHGASHRHTRPLRTLMN